MRARRGANDPSGEDAQSFYTGTELVSLQRPGGGTGGTPWDIERAPDAHDRATPRQTFVHWDAKFVAWLERSGYDVEYATDLDLHERPSAALTAHRLVICAGHDEYWSDDMRWHLEEFVRGGGNVAFFGGNLLWWRVRVFDQNRSIERIGHFNETVDPQTGDAYDESALTGVTFAHGGGHWIGERVATGFTVNDDGALVARGHGARRGRNVRRARASGRIRVRRSSVFVGGRRAPRTLRSRRFASRAGGIRDGRVRRRAGLAGRRLHGRGAR